MSSVGGRVFGGYDTRLGLDKGIATQAAAKSWRKFSYKPQTEDPKFQPILLSKGSVLDFLGRCGQGFSFWEFASDKEISERLRNVIATKAKVLKLPGSNETDKFIKQELNELNQSTISSSGSNKSSNPGSTRTSTASSSDSTRSSSASSRLIIDSPRSSLSSSDSSQGQTITSGAGSGVKQPPKIGVGVSNQQTKATGQHHIPESPAVANLMSRDAQRQHELLQSSFQRNDKGIEPQNQEDTLDSIPAAANRFMINGVATITEKLKQNASAEDRKSIESPEGQNLIKQKWMELNKSAIDVFKKQVQVQVAHMPIFKTLDDLQLQQLQGEIAEQKPVEQKSVSGGAKPVEVKARNTKKELSPEKLKDLQEDLKATYNNECKIKLNEGSAKIDRVSVLDIIIKIKYDRNRFNVADATNGMGTTALSLERDVELYNEGGKNYLEKMFKSIKKQAAPQLDSHATLDDLIQSLKKGKKAR